VDTQHGSGAGTSATEHVDDLELPAMLLHESALAHNVTTMAEWCAERGVLLAPHAKTHMSREIVALQHRAGAWGMTAATPRQVRQLASWGVTRIVQANVLVDDVGIREIAELLRDPALEYYCYVDGILGLERLESGLAASGTSGRPRVLVELGFPGGRTGVREDGDARALLARVAVSAHLELAGVAGFEGLMPRPDGSPFPAGSRDLLERMHSLVEYGVSRGLFHGRPVVTAGGSSYFDLVADVLGPGAWSTPVDTVLRSGCYVTHDHDLYALTSPLGQDPDRAAGAAHTLRPALELRATVLSAPEPGLVIVGFGRRDAPTDARLPIVLGATDDTDVAEWTVVGVNDHHAFLHVPPGASAAPGTVLRFGISHPCGAFDRWRSLPLVDGGGRVRTRIDIDL
jgi:D-serine dehydratase